MAAAVMANVAEAAAMADAAEIKNRRSHRRDYTLSTRIVPTRYDWY
jgi:hypothetical protein